MLIDSILPGKFCRAALLGYDAVLEDYDLVRVRDGSHSVCDDHDCFVPDQAGQ